ncbi:MAG: SDR family oxidoreductase [Actinomycetes bacterium]
MTFFPKTAIVTGSNSGIGRATAVALAEAGMDVGITWHSGEDGAHQTAREVEKRGRRAVVARLDTSEPLAGPGLVDHLAEELGGLDVFVNNAGMNKPMPFLETDFETWRTILSVNLDGAFLCMQRAAQRMIAAGTGGRIIAVTSVHQEQPRVGSAAYDASKHALGGLVRTMALELVQQGVTVNAVLPGEIATPMNDAEDQNPEEMERPGIPIGRPGAADEVASVIAFLASPASSYVNGASWAVDGGMLQMGSQAGSHLKDHDWRKG